MASGAFTAPLALSIDSRPALEATAAIDKMADAAVRGEGKVKQILSAADALTTALKANTDATTALTVRLGAVDTAGTAAQRSLGGVATAATTAKAATSGLATELGATTTNVVRFTGASNEARTRLDALGSAARNAAAGWKELGEQGKIASLNIAATDRLSSLRSTGGASSSAQAGRAPRPDELRNLAMQGGDILSSAASGGSLATIALQQGPQIAQIFGPGGASVGGVFAATGKAASGLAAGVGLVGGAIAAVGVAAVAGIAAFVSYGNTQKELQLNLAGVGKAAGTSAAQINAIAAATASSSGLSVREARSMAGEFASTGKIGAAMYSDLLGSAKDYAATTGQELPAATKALAAAFADPSRGADALNAQLGFLNETTRENIQRLQAQGDKLGAQKAFFDAYKASLTSSSELTSGWGRITTATANIISDAWDKVGQTIDRAATGGDLDTRIAALRKALESAPDVENSFLGRLGIAGQQIPALRAELEKLVVQQQKVTTQSDAARKAAASLALGDLVKGYNPLSEQLKKLQDDATKIKTELAAGVLDPIGNSRRTMDGLLIQAKQLASDMAAGGAQFADAIARAKFDQRTVGFSPTAKSAADINEDARVKDLNALRDAGNNAASEAYLKAAQSIEQVRVTELQTLQSRTLLDAGANGSSRYSKSLADAPAQYRDAYYRSSLASGVNADLLVSQGFRESGFNPNAVSPAGAKGIAQFMDPTARGVGLSNSFDPIQSIMKQGELMAQLLKQFNGNETLALVGYNAGPRTAERYRDSGFDPSVLRKETRDYIPAITTARPGAEQMVKTYDSLDRAQRDAGKSVDDLTKYYGKNGQALELAQAQQAKYSELLGQGVPAQQAASIAYSDLTRKIVEFGQSAKMVQFASDNQFNREQLGRSASEQNAYAQARSRIGDTTSPDAQRMIGDIRETNDLIDAKNSASSALSGFASELRNGATAAQAAASAFGRLADTFLNKAIDSVVSSAFGSVAKGGLASLWPFADGGIMTSNGPLPLHSYASGGIANSPQLALFGEGRGAEAFVPLPDGKRIPVAMSGPANINSAPSRTDARSYAIDLRGSTLTEGQVRAQLAQAIAAHDAEINRTFGQRFSGWKEDA